MAAGIERKYIILFAILIALTGFTFESQQSKDNNRFENLSDTLKTNTAVSSLTEHLSQP